MGFQAPRIALRSWATIAGIAMALATAFFFRSSPGTVNPSPAIHDPSRGASGGPTSTTGGSQGDPENEKTRICDDIHAFVCRKKGVHRDPTGSVRPDLEGEILALRSYQNIIHQHPEWTSEQVDQEFVDLIYTPKIRGRMESAFHWVRHAMLKFIDKQPETVFNAQEKRQLKQRLNETRLDLPTRASPYPDEPDLLTKSDVFYEGVSDSQSNFKMRLRIGGAYPLSAKSWFNIVFTMAHELAHSIDPCEVRFARQSYPAYDRLSACFLRNGLIATRKTRTECGQNDQLSEVFADWVAVQISAEALSSFSTEFKGAQILAAASNSVRDLCEEDDGLSEEDIELHPPARVRINKIFGKNPRIRELLGCGQVTEEPEYCTL